MPGIVGLVTGIPREQAEPQLHRMVEIPPARVFLRDGNMDR